MSLRALKQEDFTELFKAHDPMFLEDLPSEVYVEIPTGKRSWGRSKLCWRSFWPGKKNKQKNLGEGFINFVSWTYFLGPLAEKQKTMEGGIEGCFFQLNVN